MFYGISDRITSLNKDAMVNRIGNTIQLFRVNFKTTFVRFGNGEKLDSNTGKLIPAIHECLSSMLPSPSLFLIQWLCSPMAEQAQM